MPRYGRNLAFAPRVARAVVGALAIPVIAVSASCNSDGPSEAGLNQLRVQVAVDSISGGIPANFRMPFLVLRGPHVITGLPIMVTSTDTNVVRAVLDSEPPQAVRGQTIGPGLARVVISVQDGQERAADTLVILAR